MDINEAADILKVSVTTIRRWIRSGRLKAELEDGPYGPQYEITPEALEKAKAYQPKTIIIQNTNQATQLELQTAVERAIGDSIAKEMAKAEQGIKQELDSLKSELEAVKAELAAGIDARDQRLMEGIRAIQERQKEEQEHREQLQALPWWKRMFKG